MTVGQKIRHYRKQLGLSQEELAQKMQVSRQTVSLWENDQTMPTIDNLVRLKEIFGVSIDEILTRQPEQERPSFILAEEEGPKQQEKPFRDRWQKWGIGLFVAALVSIVVAALAATWLSERTMLPTNSMWIFFAFLPIPLASVVLGFVLKRRGYGWRKNVIAGFIVAGLMVAYGSFTFIFAGMYDNSDAHIRAVEAYTGIDIPRHSGICTQNWSENTQISAQGVMHFSSEVRFRQADVEAFETSLASDSRWQTEMKSQLRGLRIMPLQYGGCYVLMYNIDEETFNAVPSAEGDYRFVCIFYNAMNNTMYLEEYTLHYVQ